MNDIEKKIVQVISSYYKLDYHDAANLIMLELQLDRRTSSDAEKQCFAYVKNKHGICRCARGKTDGDFCKTHAVRYKEKRLSHGCYKTEQKLVATQKITIQDKEYFHDSKTNKIYSSGPVPQFIGYLKDDGETIDLIHEELAVD